MPLALNMSGWRSSRNVLVLSASLVAVLVVLIAASRSSLLDAFHTRLRVAVELNKLSRGLVAHKCLLYDRPMRTGSTTITTALRHCLKQTPGWAFAVRTAEGDYHHVIRNALRVHHNETVARNLVIMQHMWISDADVHMLFHKCAQVLYVSSCARLSEQVWSAAKMLSNVRENGNSSLDDVQMRAATAWTEAHAVDYARFYESYPHILSHAPLQRQDNGRFPDIPPSFERIPITRAFAPHFVVRKHFMETDLSALLAAMRCTSSFKTKNVHAVSHDEREREQNLMTTVMNNQKVGDGKTFARLNRIAEENNTVGLERVVDFLSMGK